MADAIKGTYAYLPAAEAGGSVLPLRILVVGSFYPDDTDIPDVYPDPVTLPLDISLLMRQKPVTLRRVVPCSMMPGGLDIALTFSCLDDFAIESFAVQLPLVRQGLILRDKLVRKAIEPGTGKVPPECSFFSTWLAERHDQPACVVVAQLDAMLREVLIAVYEDPVLRQLESSWLGLDLLARGKPPGCQVALLSLPVGCLESELCSNADARDTAFYECVYSRAYGQFGGVPFAAVIMDRSLGAEDANSDLVHRLAALGEMIHAPFLLQPSPQYLGLSDWGAMITASGPCPGSIRLAERLGPVLSQYIVLAAPGMVLRPRRCMAHRTCTHPLFEEPAGGLVSGNPAYAIGRILLDSAARTGSFTDIGGISAARITVLSAVDRADGAIRFPPLQTRLPPATVSALLRSGVSVLSANDETPFFPGLVSLAFALASERQDGHDQERLSYLFMVLRMAHCLKVVGREAVGSNASVSEVDATLSKWLRQFVSDVEHPATALRARRPLRQAAVQVHEEQDRPGVFAVTLKMVPHSHHLSANGELSVSLLVGG